MATNKKSVLLYCDLIHTVDSLTDVEAGKLFKHYLRYINDLNPISDDRLTTLLFEPIKQNLKRDLKKWESKSERNSLIAKEGWEKRKNANASERTKHNAKNADKDTVTVKDIFIPPTQIEVENYFLEKGYKKEAGIKAFNYYNESNWKDGKGNKVKNWKQKMQGVWFKEENEIRVNTHRPDISGLI